jgi:nitrate/nitrite transporter NarK
MNKFQLKNKNRHINHWRQSPWFILVILVFAFAQVHLHRVAFAVLIPTFIKTFHFTYFESGIIMSAFFWSHAAVQIPVGIFSDKYGANRVVKVCVAILTIGVIAFVLSHNMVEMLISRILMGFGGALLVPGVSIIRKDIHPRYHGLAVGIITAGGAFGGTVGLILISFLIGIWSWRFSYAITIIPIFLALFLVILFIMPVTTINKSDDITVKKPKLFYSDVIRNPALWLLSFSVLFFFGAYFSFLTWLPSFLVEHFNTSNYQAGLITSLATAGTIISWPLAGFLADRLDRHIAIFRYSQFLSFLLIAAFSLLMFRTSIIWTIIASLTMGLVFGGMSLPYVIVLKLFPLELVGTANGIMNTFSFIGALSIPVVLGMIIDYTGNFSFAFDIMAICFLLAFMFSYNLKFSRNF